MGITGLMIKTQNYLISKPILQPATTNTRYVCIYLNAFLMVNLNLVMILTLLKLKFSAIYSLCRLFTPIPSAPKGFGCRPVECSQYKTLNIRDLVDVETFLEELFNF